MTQLMLEDVRPMPFPPRCRHYDGPRRCPASAVAWLVSEEGRAILAVCQPHAVMYLADYAAAAADIPELAGWYAAPIVLADHAACIQEADHAAR